MSYSGPIRAQTGPLLQACSQFCRMAGAQRVLSSQAPGPAGTPPQIQLLRMTRSRAGLPETDAALRPLLPELAEDFLRIYRKGMSRVPAVLTLRDTDIPQILARGGAYFVHRDETPSGNRPGRERTRFCRSFPAVPAPDGT